MFRRSNSERVEVFHLDPLAESADGAVEGAMSGPEIRRAGGLLHSVERPHGARGVSYRGEDMGSTSARGKSCAEFGWSDAAIIEISLSVVP